jgi:hypothetical protein
MVWLGQLPVMVTLAPATKPGVEVPFPPFATDNGKAKLPIPTPLQVFAEVQE